MTTLVVDAEIAYEEARIFINEGKTHKLMCSLWTGYEEKETGLDHTVKLDIHSHIDNVCKKLSRVEFL